MEPLYTPGNTTAAYQLNWSLALFANIACPEPANWLSELREATEKDGCRILSVESSADNVLQFWLSSRPESSASDCVRCIKGRLQYLLRGQLPIAFRRNYHIQSVGETNSAVLDAYVANQTAKHPMADLNVQARFESVQFFDPAVDLSKCLIGNYGRYVNSLHIVLETLDGWREVRPAALHKTRSIIIAAARKKGWQLSRIGLLCNHMHVLVGAEVATAPQEVALALMNNIAYAQGMKAVLRYSYYAGTFSGIDRGALRPHGGGVAISRGPAGRARRRPREPDGGRGSDGEGG